MEVDRAFSVCLHCFVGAFDVAWRNFLIYSLFFAKKSVISQIETENNKITYEYFL